MRSQSHKRNFIEIEKIYGSRGIFFYISLVVTNKPMGVSEYTYTQLPALIQQALPTIQQFTERLNQNDEDM